MFVLDYSRKSSLTGVQHPLLKTQPHVYSTSTSLIFFFRFLTFIHLYFHHYPQEIGDKIWRNKPVDFGPRYAQLPSPLSYVSLRKKNRNAIKILRRPLDSRAVYFAFHCIIKFANSIFLNSRDRYQNACFRNKQKCVTQTDSNFASFFVCEFQ